MNTLIGESSNVQFSFRKYEMAYKLHGYNIMQT